MTDDERDAGPGRPYRILMVCMGNICRSPTAEQVLRDKLARAGLATAVQVDSAGTHAHWHEGEPPDERSRLHARARGYDLGRLRARRVVDADFDRFDLMLAMDWDNLALLEARQPPGSRARLRRLSEFSIESDSPVVPDPYHGHADQFEAVLDLVEDACDGLVRHLQASRPRRDEGTT